jgi:peptide chain release factor
MGCMSHWVQITAGRGPAECQWVVGKAMDALRREARDAGVAVELLDAVPGEAAHTYQSMLLSLEGEGVAALLAGWVGTVQWVGRSRYRPNHKRRNWFIGVEALAVPERPRWSEREVQFSTMRSAGPGGQHVNKTESAVRVVHLPTGLSAVAREERSQQQNRRLALARLAALFAAEGERRQDAAARARWDQHNDLVRGNPVRIYEGEDFRRWR